MFYHYNTLMLGSAWQKLLRQGVLMCIWDNYDPIMLFTNISAALGDVYKQRAIHLWLPIL